jgi:sugar transferase (PEP-CTERM system associated)
MVALWLTELSLAFVLVCAMTDPLQWDVLALAGLRLSAQTVQHAGFLAVTLGASAGAIGLYRPDICIQPRRVATHAALVATLAFPAALLIGGLFNTDPLGTYAIWLAKVLFLWVVIVLACRCVLRAPISRAISARRIGVVGSPAAAARIEAALRSRRTCMFEIVDLYDPESRLPEPADLRRAGIWALIAAGPTSTDVVHSLMAYRLSGARVFEESGFSEQMLGRVSLKHLDPAWFLSPNGFSTGRISAALKRLTDLVVSIVMLVVSLPVMLMTALAVRLDSPGPIFYRQERVGLGGRSFTLMKFRSMREDAEAPGRPVWAVQSDPRVTRVGAFIRMARIDELPQLFNVLRGEMSLVGPRPERPHFVRELGRVIPFYAERSYVRPGITGWAQVNYPYGASVEDAREKLSYDLYYLRHRSFFFDLLILAATVRVILFREGAR